jgi:hypothetical protein
MQNQQPLAVMLNHTSVSENWVDFASSFMYTAWRGALNPACKDASITSTMWLPALELVKSSEHAAAYATFRAFVQRTYQSACLTHGTLYMGLLLFTRICTSSTFPVSSQPGAEASAFIATLILASKLLMDNSYTNKSWTKISRVPLATLNMLEREILSLLQYQVHVDVDEFVTWLHHVSRMMHAHKEALGKMAPVEGGLFPAFRNKAATLNVGAGILTAQSNASRIPSPSDVMSNPIEIFKRS